MVDWTNLDLNVPGTSGTVLLYHALLENLIIYIQQIIYIYITKQVNKEIYILCYMFIPKGGVIAWGNLFHPTLNMIYIPLLLWAFIYIGYIGYTSPIIGNCHEEIAYRRRSEVPT